MLKILGALLSIIVIVLGGYSLITKDLQFMSYLMFFLGSALVVSALLEFKRKQGSLRGYVNIGFSVFVFILFIQRIIAS